jgi:CheY-like chemotaxis protein
LSTWMVVEDEPDIYDVLLAMFEIWGIEGVAFVDGAEAQAWIENVDQGRVRGDMPELAILDIRLPEVSGPELGNRLRRSPVLKDVAIVLITAYRLTPAEEQAVVELAQADLLMYKPLPAMAELRRTMDEVIAKHKHPAPNPAKTPEPPPTVSPVSNEPKPTSGLIRPSSKPSSKSSSKPSSEAHGSPNHKAN